MEQLDSLRKHLVDLLRGGQAYDTFEATVEAIPARLRGVAPADGIRSPWQIVEHLRLSQKDILDYCNNMDASYKELDWPDDYWPQRSEPPEEDSWDRAVAAYTADRFSMERMVNDPQRDLFAPFPWEPAHTLLREVLLAADHTAYHVGELVIVQAMLEKNL